MEAEILFYVAFRVGKKDWSKQPDGMFGFCV